MSTLEIVLFGSITPIAALLIAWWVFDDAKKITAQANARAARERDRDGR
ncbi:hypothetical protein [Fulvimarina sp. MAC3]